MSFTHPLLRNPAELASYRGWNEDVYRDLLRVRSGELDEASFRTRYEHECAIFVLDMTGLTSSAMHRGELQSLLRIVDAQAVVIPVLKEHGATLIRCLADDIVALFERPSAAVDAALEIHRRIAAFNASGQGTEDPTQCCIGVGYGRAFAIGPNLAQGDEMNRASKLGEDIARANETLVTENVYEKIRGRDDLHFEAQDEDDQLFPYYRVTASDQ